MKKLFYIFIFSLFLLSSCTEVIDFDLNTSLPRLVVEGSITTETKAHIVKLTKTSSYYYSQTPNVVTGANVTISDGANIFLLTESPAGSGIYKTADNVTGEVNKTYTLTIISEGVTYTATSTIEAVAPIDSIHVVQLYENMPFGGVDSSYTLSLFAKEPASGAPDYYFWKYSINGKPQTDTLRRIVFQDDALMNGSLIIDVPIFMINHHYLNIGDTITLYQFSTDKSYIDFIMGFMYETDWRGTPFDGPPANPPTNLSNGAIGYFYASDVDCKSKIIVSR